MSGPTTCWGQSQDWGPGLPCLNTDSFLLPRPRGWGPLEAGEQWGSSQFCQVPLAKAPEGWFTPW